MGDTESFEQGAEQSASAPEPSGDTNVDIDTQGGDATTSVGDTGGDEASGEPAGDDSSNES